MTSTRRLAASRRISAAVVALLLLVACSSTSRSNSSPTTKPSAITTTSPGSSSTTTAPGAVTAGAKRDSVRRRVPVPTVKPFTTPSKTKSSAPGPGYIERELIMSGTAHAFEPKGTLPSSGRWNVAPAAPARYATRLIVRRPADPKRFNGTVVVEWMNVTAGSDTSPDWMFAHTELMRDGFAWVGVSAQKIGVDAAKGGDPARYGSLSHPGDAYSYDIYSQAGQAVGRPAEVDPLAGLSKTRRLIAEGESQSAIRMTSYVDAVHPVAEVYDGFLIHSRFGSGAPLGAKGDKTGAGSTRIRDDLDVPMLVVSSETDVGFNHSARQADSARYRLWEIAGTAHADTYILGGPIAGTGTGVATQRFGACSAAVNSAPMYEVVDAAIWSLNRWITQGVPPPRAPRLMLIPGSKGKPVRDRYGNALGGIRLPQLDVPTETLTGGGNGGGAFCSLFGSTVPFDSATLKRLYPDHATYVAAFTKATQRLQQQGFILPPDARAAIRSARESTVGT